VILRAVKKSIQKEEVNAEAAELPPSYKKGAGAILCGSGTTLDTSRSSLSDLWYPEQCRAKRSGEFLI